MPVGMEEGLCVRWGPDSPLPKKLAEPLPQFSALVHCGQMAGWLKMALGIEVGLGSHYIVLDWDSAPLPKIFSGWTAQEG